jgi:hypothetical protein
MIPFTEYYKLRAFARNADGDFGYIWCGGSRFIELIRYDIRGEREYICESVNKAIDKRG